jgi:hypothetical protein
MGFATVIVTIIYIVAYSMEMEERAQRKREQEIKALTKF